MNEKRCTNWEVVLDLVARAFADRIGGGPSSFLVPVVSSDPMTAGASHIALIKLGQDVIPGGSASDEPGNISDLQRGIPVVQVQGDRVRVVPAVDAALG